MVFKAVAEGEIKRESVEREEGSGLVFSLFTLVSSSL